jgi:hypothetical protein
MDYETFQPGTRFIIQKDSPGGRYSAFFEDEGETGYFYAVDPAHKPDAIVDAVHIYNVSNVVDRERLSAAHIVWSADESKCALLINGHPHAVFDFAAKKGYCRSNFPNFANPVAKGWLQSDHSWSEDAIRWLNMEQP